MRREERVTVQGRVKKQQPDGMWETESANDVLEGPYIRRRESTPLWTLTPPPFPPIPMFEADILNSALAPSVPSGFMLTNLRPAFGRDHGRRGLPAKPPNLQTPSPPIIVVVSNPCQENCRADSAHKSVLESAKPRMDSEGASGCTWSTAWATARLHDS